MLVILLIVHPANVVERIAYTFQGNEGGVGLGSMHLDSSSSARLSSWTSGLEAFTRHPFLGWGITGYGFLDAQYFRVLVELGLIGLIAFAALLAATGRTFHLAFRRLSDPLHRGLALGMAAAFGGLVFHAIGANTFILIRIMEPFWLLTGLVLAAMSMEASPHLEEADAA